MELLFVALIALLGFGLFFFALRRLLRLAIRLAFWGAILIALGAGAVAWRWQASLDDAPGPDHRRSTPARPPR